MVVRDNEGTLLYLATDMMTCNSAYTAEVKALAWASAFAEEVGWKNVIWSVDAKELVLGTGM